MYMPLHYIKDYNAGQKKKMKCHVTRKDIKNNYSYIMDVYNTPDHLLYYENPFAYNSGTYGWNWDAYEINGVVIIKGYRNRIGKKIGYNITRPYEEKAMEITDNKSLSYSERKKMVRELLNDITEKFKKGEI